MISNYHTHTRWCRHGTGEIEDYISKAIELGMKEIAITEHVPLNGNPDSSRMLFEEFNAYNREFDQVIEKYQERSILSKDLKRSIIRKRWTGTDISEKCEDTSCLY